MKTADLARPGTVLLTGGFLDEPTVFTNPEAEIECRTPSRVEEKLREVEAAGNSGYYCVGFLSYEAGEILTGLSPRRTDFPLLWFGLYNQPRPVNLSEISPPENYELPQFEITPDIDFKTYRAGFRQIHDYISRGDSYQVNYTFRLNLSFETSAPHFFLDRLAHHPVPYGAYLQLEKYTLCSLSPELFLERTGEKLSALPMKGTVSRGKTPAEDREKKSWLAASEKNQAENLMIVDLLRNDLGRVARTGSVQVPELFEVQSYETVHQMVSSVTARLEADQGWSEVMEAAFPSGSVTGAPKKRTLEIIRQVEESPRSIYTGSIGVLEPGGDFTFNIAIRTALVDQRAARAQVGVGGGVVIDSDAESEWEEARLKGKFLRHRRKDFSLIETMRYDGNQIPLLGDHLRRLENSAGYFGIPVDHQQLEKLINDGLADEQEAVMVRLLLDRQGEYELEIKDIPPSPPEIKIRIAPAPVRSSNRFLYHKTTRREKYDRFRRKAQRGGVFEYLFVNERGQLTEGTISNLFVEMNGELLTPPVNSGVLPGVMRRQLLAENSVRERVLNPDDLKTAENIYLTNALRGKLQVDSVSYSS